MAKPAEIRSYREFWPYYLNEHSRPATRGLHLAGTGVATALIVISAADQRPWLLLGAALAGYAPAWLAHFAVEKNRPATFRYPLWSLISDFRMAAIWLSGGLERELKRAGVTPR